MDKSKTLDYCGFPLTNTHSASSVHSVAISNPDNILILLYISTANLKFVRPF
jgi:hypothetical protein